MNCWIDDGCMLEVENADVTGIGDSGCWCGGMW